LTGPKRGLALISDDYVEIDLKIKDHQGQDKELSKGYLTIDWHRVLDGCELESGSLSTRLSTVDVMYAVVKDAVEGTIAVEVLQGGFDGKITAHTSSIPNSLVLYDSHVVGAMTDDDTGALKLMQPVASVYVKEMLIIHAQTSDGSKRTIGFTPKINGGEEEVITVGVTKMRVKVAWSVMDF
jgi:azurin